MSKDWHRLSNIDQDARTADCSKCGIVKVRMRPGGRGAECWTRRTQARKRRIKRIRAAGYRKWFRGPKPIERAKMLERQDGRCALCGLVKVPLLLDHDHKTMRLRGYICRACNGKIARMGDDHAGALRRLAVVQEQLRYVEAVVAYMAEPTEDQAVA